jgi:hypothetical protein
MALTAERYQEIVRALKSDGGRHFDEKRGRPRVGVRGRVQIAPLRADGRHFEAFEVWVRDLSARGIGILHSRPLHPGTRFDAIFHRPDASPMVLGYVVAQVNRVNDELYTIGAHLVAVESDSGEAASAAGSSAPAR